MSWLVALAIIAQTSDAALTCRTLAQGGRETNPMLPQSCKGIIAMKAGLSAPMFLLPGQRNRNIWAGAMIGSGTVGVVLTVKLR